MYKEDGSDVPGAISKLPAKDKRQWAAVWNSAYTKCKKEGGGNSACEGSAFAQANGVVLKKNAIKDVSSWDGSASRFGSTESYCSACLIDVNSAAGRDTKAQDHCKLPVREPGDGAGTYVRQAVHAAAAAMGGARGGLSKPGDVSEADWGAALKSAANRIISAYSQMDETAPDSIYELAGKSPPSRARKGNMFTKFIERLKELVASMTAATQDIERAMGMNDLYYQVQELIQKKDEWAFLMDVFRDDGGGMYAVIASEGKLYRADLSIDTGEAALGDWAEVTMEFVPTGRSLTIQRQADGRYRGFLISSTCVLNRVGEIDSSELHDKMNRKAQEAGNWPYIDFFHLGRGFSMGKVDYLARDGNVAIASFLFDELTTNPVAEAMIRAYEADPSYWGASISYFPAGDPERLEVAPGVKIPVYRDGVFEAITILPEMAAASLFTTLAETKEIKRMNTAIVEALTKLAGGDDERLKEFIDRVDETNRAIQERNLITRDGETAPAAVAAEAAPVALDPEGEVTEDEEEAKPVVAEPGQPVTVEMDEEAVKAITAHILAAPAFQQIQTSIASMEEAFGNLAAQMVEFRSWYDKSTTATDERLSALERDEGDKRATWLADRPRREARQINVTYRPRNQATPAPAIQPGQPGNGKPKPGDLADIAAGTLANIK